MFDTLAVNPTFSSLVTALRAAGLAERLGGPDPVTIFAPTNAAFDLLPPARVQVSPPVLLVQSISCHFSIYTCWMLLVDKFLSPSGA